MAMLKIFHLSANQYPKISVNHATKAIWTELAVGCDQYHVFARSLDQKFSHSRQGNIHLHLVPRLINAQIIFFVLSFLLPFYFWKYRPTHIVAQCPVLGGFSAAIFQKFFKYKLFVEVHGEHYFRPIKKGAVGYLHCFLFKLLSKYTFGRSGKIRSLSSDMSELMVECYGKDILTKISIIPNRVNFNIFKNKKDRYEISGDIKIITIGRFSVIKNHINLIKDLCYSNLDFHLTLVGAGSLKSEYLLLSEKLGLTSRITILEDLTHDEIASILPKHDLYIHYSITEGVPRAIMEAMACGLPVICTNVGHARDLTKHNVNALVIEEPYKPAFISSLKNLVSSQTLREKLGRSASFHVKDNHEWNRVFDKYRNEIKTCE